MENELTLEANNRDELNKLIDIELKRGFLIAGAMKENDDGKIIQRMTLAEIMDNEITVGGLIQLIILGVVWVGLMVFFF